MARCIDRFGEAISLIRSTVNPDMAISQIAMLVEISKAGEISQSDLGEKLGMLHGTTSRNLKWLSEFAEKTAAGNFVKRGYELVEVRPDLYYRSRNNVKLTSKGKQLMEGLNKILED